MQPKGNKKELAKELITPDIEEVKKAIELIIDFEEAERISILSRKGRMAFSKIYKKEEARSRVRDMVRDEVQKQVYPLENKIDELLRMQTNNKIEEIEKPADDKLDEILETKQPQT